MEEPSDVLIIGAGLAGLTAARALARRGASVLVLEARERVGGRTLTRRLGRDAVDLGGQWIGPGQDRIAALAREFAVATFPQYSAGKKILAIGGRVSTYRHTVPSLPLLSLLDLQLAISRLERLCRQAPLDRPYDAPRAAEWDNWTVEDWQRRNVRTHEARVVLDGAVRAIFAAEPSELSFLYFLFYLRSGGGLMRLAEVKNGAQQDRFVGGAQQLAERLAAQLPGHVVCNAAVRAIEQDGAGVTVRSDAGEHHARYAIAAVPPLLAGQIAYARALSPERTELNRRVPMGSVIKCVFAYEQPFWRGAGFSGEILSDSGAIRLAFDDSPHDSSQGALVAFLLGDAARHWSGRDPAERARVLRDELVSYFGWHAAAPIAYTDKDWTAEVWSRGCYVGIMPPGVLTAWGRALREPCGRIHWAGTETALRWTGYMDGAIESGERVADEIAVRL